MSDEDDRHPDLIPEVQQHIQDRRSGAGIDHGRRLIGQQDLRLQEEDPGDHQTLHLSAGKLERIFVRQLRKLQIDKAAGFRHHLGLFLLGKVFPSGHIDAVQKDRVDLVKDIEGRERILENCLDVFPVFFFLASCRNISGLSPEKDLSFRNAQKSQQHLGERRLSASALSHDTDQFSFPELKIHMVHGHGLFVARSEDPGHSLPAQAQRVLRNITAAVQADGAVTLCLHSHTPPSDAPRNGHNDRIFLPHRTP